jgi:hypothetical protein
VATPLQRIGHCGQECSWSRMNTDELKLLVKNIVKEACELKNKHTSLLNASVNYACIFSQSDEEYRILFNVTNKIGKIIKNTPTGPIFKIKPLNTVSGKLLLLKVRFSDSTRKERGDADFTVPYLNFKGKYLDKRGFKLIERENFEMIELTDKEFNVRVYFSNPPLDEQFKIVTRKYSST